MVFCLLVEMEFSLDHLRFLLISPWKSNLDSDAISFSFSISLTWILVVLCLRMFSFCFANFVRDCCFIWTLKMLARAKEREKGLYWVIIYVNYVYDEAILFLRVYYQKVLHLNIKKSRLFFLLSKNSLLFFI